MSRICKLCYLLIFLVLMKRTESSSPNQNTEDENFTVNGRTEQFKSLNVHLDIMKHNLESVKDMILAKLSVEHNIEHKKQGTGDENQTIKTANPTLNCLHPDVNAFLDAFTSQNNKLTESILQTQALLSEVLAEEDQQFYDEHFNCIHNCSIPTCLSSNYAEYNVPTSVPQSCAEATAKNDFNNGVYLLKLPHLNSIPFYAYCDHKDGRGNAWTVIQRREDGTVNFNRNWLDYKRGFGNLYGEYWIGLERLHAITKDKPQALWISIKDRDNTYSHVTYWSFAVASESEGYKLTLEGPSGYGAEHFRPYNNEKFSTFDRDNDSSYLNCARVFKSGWWFKNCRCCSLNGVFYSLSNPSTISRPLDLNNWTGEDASVRYIQMAIRPLY